MNIINPASYQLDFQKIRKKTQINDIHSLELYLINIFNDLSRRETLEKQEKSIDKITFIEYMKISYIVGEKLFHVFDKNRKGLLNLSDFVSGIINLYSGGLEETQKIIFNLLDFDFDGKIIPEDSRLLILFIKNLNSSSSGVIGKIKLRTTLTEEEDLDEINILIKNFFGNYSVMDFEQFKQQIENFNSDVFFLFICFLYNSKPFHDSSIRVLKQSCVNSNNINVSSNSVINSSFDNLYKTSRSRIKSPSKVFKTFISDVIDMDVDELEKDCEDNVLSDDYQSDPEDFTLLTDEDCTIKTIPFFNPKINLEINKIENDFMRKNTVNKKAFGSLIINKTYINYVQRKENYKSITLNYKEHKFLNGTRESTIMPKAFNMNNTFNNNLIENRAKLSIINGTFIRNDVSKLNNENKTFKNTIIGPSSKIEEDSIENNSSYDGTWRADKLDSKNSKEKVLQNINKSPYDYHTPFLFKNKPRKANVKSDEYNLPKNQAVEQNNELVNNLTKNANKKRQITDPYVKQIYLKNKNNYSNLTNQKNESNNYRILNSSSNMNRNLSPDSTRVSNNCEIFASDIIFEGYIYRSDVNNHLKKYFTVLVGNDLYYFSNSKKDILKGIHNLSGTYIFKDSHTIKVVEKSANELKDKNANELKKKDSLNSNKNFSSFRNQERNQIKKIDCNDSKTVNYFAFKLYFKRKCRIYFCVSEEDVKNWVEKIRTVTEFRDIKESYEIGEELGQGKFGKVKIGKPKRRINKSANDNLINEEDTYAIKIINKVNLKSLEMELVKSEIEIMKFCRFRNIVKLIENFEDHENIYIILEYLSGGNLNNFLSSQKTLLSEDKIKKIILQIASGINYLHHFGIIHRDLKPENIMMSDKTQNSIIKIVDFGLSKVLGIFEKSDEAYGTLAYAAPEVIKKTAYNKTVDIWSLGVILYFIMSGYFPFNDKNNNLQKIAMDIISGEIKFFGNSWNRADNDNTKDLILRCLERDVNKRIDIENFINHKWFKK